MRNLIFLFLIFIVPTNALGLIEVDITRGNLNPLPIAVSPLSIDDESKKNFEKTLKTVSYTHLTLPTTLTV